MRQTIEHFITLLNEKHIDELESTFKVKINFKYSNKISDCLLEITTEDGFALIHHPFDEGSSEDVRLYREFNEYRSALEWAGEAAHNMAAAPLIISILDEKETHELFGLKCHLDKHGSSKKEDK